MLYLLSFIPCFFFVFFIFIDQYVRAILEISDTFFPPRKLIYYIFDKIDQILSFDNLIYNELDVTNSI